MRASAYRLAMEGDLSRDEIMRLSQRRNGPASIKLAIQVAALFGALTWTAQLAQLDHPAKWIALLAAGLAVFSFFPLLHEAGHETAFASRVGNTLGVWLGAFVMLQAPSFFREFHWEHHRSTQDPEKDPEIASAPSVLDGYPRNLALYLGLATGQHLWIGKIGFTLLCALAPASIWRGVFPFVRPSAAGRVAWESRAVALGWIALLWLGTTEWPGFAFALLAWPIAHLFLGLYVLPEHTGLPNTGDQRARTRTLETNRLVRALMWNMPYHSEHHAYPGVPFHALPALHASLGPTLPNRSHGYVAFHREAAVRAWRTR